MPTEPAGGIASILLAAGASTRLGRPKQLVEVEGRALVRRQAEVLARLRPAPLIVVTGSGAAEVMAALSGLPVQQAHNRHWRRGMGASLACGIRALPDLADAALVLLCDQWKIVAEDLQRLCLASSKQPRGAIVSAFDDTMGPPAIFPRTLFGALAALEGEEGARPVLGGWDGAIVPVPVANASSDLDYPRDLPLK